MKKYFALLVIAVLMTMPAWVVSSCEEDIDGSVVSSDTTTVRKKVSTDDVNDNDAKDDAKDDDAKKDEDNNGGNDAEQKDIEHEFFDLMNLARTQPKIYSERYIKPLLNSMEAKLYGSDDILECIAELDTITPVEPLKWSDGLHRAAAEWVDEQGATTEIGHASNWSARIKKYGSVKSWMGENISYGGSSAADMVSNLMVDRGTSGRGHRRNIMSPLASVVCVAVGPHKSYGYMSVTEFTDGFTEKE